MSDIIRNTCLEMIQQRGFEISENIDEYIIGEKLSGDAVAVFFDDSQKLDTDKVKLYIAKMKDLDLKACVIVYKNAVTAPAKKVIDELQEYSIEIFNESCLRYNITKHRLVPKHSVLSKSKTSEFKKMYGVKIPVLLNTDQIARFYNFQRGDIIRIDRNDDTVTFRIVK